jgi:hypothetical protein
MKTTTSATTEHNPHGGFSQQLPPPSKKKLVICAGPERSGSTWLYNAVRHLHSAAGIPCDSYWIHHLEPEKLTRRLEDPTCHVVCIKTHKYFNNNNNNNNDYDDWLFHRQFHPIILLTHRDLREVVTSYRRVGWTRELPAAYVQHHIQWQSHADLDLRFRDIVQQPISSLQTLATTLDLQLDTETLNIVARRIQDLPIPTTMVDPVTKLWPSHREDPSHIRQHGSTKQWDDDKKPDLQDLDVFLEQYPEFYRLYPDLR